VTDLLTAAIVAVSGLVGAAIGVAGGLVIARQNNEAQLKATREARSEERRATAYFGVMVAWNTFLQSNLPLIYPDQKASPHLLLREDELVHTRSRLGLDGTVAVQRLHDQAIAATQSLIGVEKAMRRIRTDDDRETLRRGLAEIGDRVAALESQMNRELHPGDVGATSKP